MKGLEDFLVDESQTEHKVDSGAERRQWPRSVEKFIGVPGWGNEIPLEDVFEQGIFPSGLPPNRWSALKEMRLNHIMSVSVRCILSMLEELAPLLPVVPQDRLNSFQAEYNTLLRNV